MNKKRKKNKNTLLPILAVAVVIAAIVCGCAYASSSDKDGENATATVTPTSTAAQTEETQTTQTGARTESTVTQAKTADKPNDSSSGSNSSPNASKAEELYLDKFSSVPQSGIITASDISVGQNILVNNDYEYNFNQSTDFIYFENLSGRVFKVMFDNLDVDRFTGYEFNLMTKAYKSVYPNEYLGVCSGFRTYATQKRNFDNSVARVGEEETLKWYTRPGYSEHHTGYAVDFNTDSYGDSAFTGKGNQSWFKSNCQKYGFILRYTAEKKSITGVNPEAWHFRQVGIPHADYIMKNNICYEEYVDLLRSYSYDNPLKITPDAGATYYVYYQEAGSGSTEINVSGYSKYYCSGNNVDGFIITAVK